MVVVVVVVVAVAVVVVVVGAGEIVETVLAVVRVVAVVVVVVVGRSTEHNSVFVHVPQHHFKPKSTLLVACIM